ncbi:MAG: biotin carboxylase N-terminal domain-containing protein, partial [Pseudomonadota bacterium]|nr:biotin carboxylase N-terminal domain-containing protein [Pseudomonadota bacterium]
MNNKTLLIANRGEIAIRIARAATDLGIETVGIAPRDDLASLHMRHVDHAVELTGSGPAAYLDIEQIIAVAASRGCDAIHPGYGFLSENAEFAHACEAAGIAFVGPRAETLAMFGDKVRAREVARRLGVPLPEGSEAGVSLDEARAFMEGLGKGGAAMIKAVAGGGGRGMRVVRQVEDLDEAYKVCRSEAKASFGKDAVYIERYIDRARHVEVQIFGDGLGKVLHLWDRECSLQRRHQKLVEIAPCPGMSIKLRQGVIDAAVTMARDAAYRSLGTFEFLVDTRSGGDGAFFFMEANPRLQVEHTVTEEVTGIDLVSAQLQLVFGQTADGMDFDAATPPRVNGYAIQARINMERMTPDGTALPSGGTLAAFDIPSGPGIRVDTMGYTGYRASPSYDSLLAKVIAHSGSSNFGSALARLRRALDETRIVGVETNLDFLRALLASEDVAQMQFHTQFVERSLPELLAAGPTRNRHFEISPEDVAGPVAGGHRPTAAIPDDHVGVAAPMPGAIIEINVGTGDVVAAGQQMAVVEAMKMQMAVTSRLAGRVEAVNFESGDVVDVDAVLFVIAPEEGASEDAAGPDEHDLDSIRPELQEYFERRATLSDEARPEAVARRRKIGKRMLRENLAEFFDETRFVEYGSLTFAAQRSRRSIEELIRISPADGLITAVGSVNSDKFGAEAARCMALAYDYTVLAGTQGFNAHHKKDRMLMLAEKWDMPVMVWAEGGGGRPGDTDYHAISGLSSMTFNRLAALNGKVPLIGIVTGRCFAGNAAMLGCCDVIIATRDSTIGMAGPAMIEGGGLGVVKAEEIGPVSVQAPNGVIDLLVEDEEAAVAEARRYLGYFQGQTAGWELADQRNLRHRSEE